jgi:hypothetical protein
MLIILFLINAGIACGDMIIMSPEEQELREKFNDSPSQGEVVAAFNSRHYLLHQQAIMWMILNRDTKTWEGLKDQKGKLKETSLKLYPILDLMTAQRADKKRPLILSLDEEYLKNLVRKEEELPPRPEYSYVDPPVDEVLYELLAKDLNRVASSSEDVIEAARLLLRYRAPSDNLERLVQGKAVIDKAEYKDGKIRQPPNQKSSLPIKSPENSKRSLVNQPKRFSYSRGYGWMIPATFLVLLVIFACWRVSRNTR